MPAPGAVTFTPFVDIYGMLSLKDIRVSSWEDDSGSNGDVAPYVPLRTPLFKSRIDPTSGAPAQDQRNVFGASQDARIEAGANLTRTWVLFFEKIAELLKRVVSRSRRLHALVCYIDETETDQVWAEIQAVDASTDPIVVGNLIPPPLLRSLPQTDASPYPRDWVVGDYVVWNDPERSAVDLTRRRYECGQITAISDTGDWTIRRHWPESTPGNRATFGSYMEAHPAVRLYRIEVAHFTYEIVENAFMVDSDGNRSGVPKRWDIVLPHAAVVAVYMAAENSTGMGPATEVNCSYPYTSINPALLPPAPGLRTHVGAAYWFEEPGTIALRTRPEGLTFNFYPTLPIRIQDWATIRTMYGFLGTPSGDLTVRVKILRASERLPDVQLYDPSQPWRDLEDLVWASGEISSADKGPGWTAPGTSNPPRERRMPYCENDLFYWDPEDVGDPDYVKKAWPVPVMEADAWLTFDIVSMAGAPADISVVVQT
jgi:hypothetical protein